MPFAGQKSKSGWAVVRHEPWHVAEIYSTRKQAEAKARQLGEEYKVFRGEQPEGADNFVITPRQPRRDR